MIIGERIRERREAKNLKQSQLAEIIGNDGNTISRWEHNKIGIGDKYVTKLAQALDTSADYLLGTTDDPTPPEAITQTAITTDKIDNMIIIKNWDTRQTICFPNNEEGRKSFVAFMNCFFNLKTPQVSNQINGNNNSGNNLGFINN